MNDNAHTITNHESYLLGIPLAATLLIWFWVGGMNLFQSPGSSMLLIGILTPGTTAAFAALEVSKTWQPGASGRSPTKWYFMIAFLWFATFPMYMYQRRHLGLPNRLLPACILSLVFCVSWTVMNSTIETRKAQVRNSLEEMRSRFSQPAN
jgi:hypothetical protein